MSRYDDDVVLVPRGARLLRAPGVTYITAPAPRTPPPSPPSSRASPPVAPPTLAPAAERPTSATDALTPPKVTLPTQPGITHIPAPVPTPAPPPPPSHAAPPPPPPTPPPPKQQHPDTDALAPPGVNVLTRPDVAVTSAPAATPVAKPAPVQPAPVAKPTRVQPTPATVTAAPGHAAATTRSPASPAPRAPDVEGLNKQSADAVDLTVYYTHRDQVPLRHGETIAFTPGKGYHAAGPNHHLPSIKTLSPTQPADGRTPPLPSRRQMAQVQPAKQGTPTTRASRTPPLTTAQLHPIQPSQTGTPIPPVSHRIGSVTGRIETSAAVSNRIHLPAERLFSVEVKTSLEASATLRWSGGPRGPTLVHLDRHGLAITVDHGPLSFTDRGHLYRSGHGVQDPQNVLFQDVPGHHVDKRSHPTVDLTVGGRSYSIKGQDVEIAKRVEAEGLHKQVVVVDVSSSVSKAVPGYGRVTLDYSLAANVEFDERQRKQQRQRSLTEEEVIAIALALLGAAVVLHRVVPQGPNR